MSGTTIPPKVAKRSARGSAPGERRGGRQKGVPNKATREIRDIARQYTAKAIKALAKVMEESDSDAARVSAANALLDRGYGRPAQAIEHSGHLTHMVSKAQRDAAVDRAMRADT